MRNFLEELDVWFEVIVIKRSRGVKTLPTIFETTTLEWYLTERDKTLGGLDNAKS